MYAIYEKVPIFASSEERHQLRNRTVKIIHSKYVLDVTICNNIYEVFKMLMMMSEIVREYNAKNNVGEIK